MLGSILMLVGAVVGFVGWIMLVIAGFKTSTLWGILNLISLFILIPLIIYIIMYWQEAKKGFLVWIAGVVIQIVGVVLGGAAMMMQMQPPVT